MELAAKWEPLLDLPGVAVQHKFIPTPRDDDNECAADTSAKWHYRIATIRWFLPTCLTMSDRGLEEVLVHEYAHVLMAALDDRIKPGSDEHVEHATESVARALLCTFRGQA